MRLSPRFWLAVVCFVAVSSLGVVLRNRSHVKEARRLQEARTSASLDFLRSVTSQEGFSSMDSLKQERILTRTIQAHPEFAEFSVLTPEGRENVRMGRSLGPVPELRDFQGQAWLQETLAKGSYHGGTRLAVSIDGKKGVLLAELASKGI